LYRFERLNCSWRRNKRRFLVSPGPEFNQESYGKKNCQDLLSIVPEKFRSLACETETDPSIDQISEKKEPESKERG